jgi:hypothetical protein
MTEPTTTDWAYLAGFVDGEGCIRSYCHGQSGCYYPLLIISQVDPAPLLWIHGIWGGLLREQKNPNYSTGGIWRLRFSGYAAIPVLRGIHPYLKVKQPQAALAISLMTRVDRWDHEIQARIHRRLSELKRVRVA